MTTGENPLPPSNLEIQIDEATAQGSYCNLAILNHTPSEFVLDFAYLQPSAPKGKVNARIILAPDHAKRLLLALEDNVRKYETRHGAIRLHGELGGAPFTPPEKFG
ncbi:MAG: DUF3467 domain-containing protein [Spirochaetes bacterium]|nr:DUF3467 domain-containing protein [Spirochaetota bacterium]